MVVPPHRDGGQAQFVTSPLPTTRTETLAPLLDWMTENLDSELTIGRLAARVNMSARTFARKFVAETGTTPARWLNDQRVLAAQQLLENSDLSMDSIAEVVGFGNAAALRQHFVRLRCTTPNSYRRTFRAAPQPV